MLAQEHTQQQLSDPYRIARAAVLNGEQIPSATQATLEARGVDVGALEQRLKEADAWRH